MRRLLNLLKKIFRRRRDGIYMIRMNGDTNFVTRFPTKK